MAVPPWPLPTTKGAIFDTDTPSLLSSSKPDRTVPPELQDSSYASHSETRHAQKLLTAATVKIDREKRSVLQSPGEFRVDLQIEHLATMLRQELFDREAIEAKEPVCLIQAVFATQRRCFERQLGRGLRDGTERRVVDPAQPI